MYSERLNILHLQLILPYLQLISMPYISPTIYPPPHLTSVMHHLHRHLLFISIFSPAFHFILPPLFRLPLPLPLPPFHFHFHSCTSSIHPFYSSFPFLKHVLPPSPYPYPGMSFSKRQSKWANSALVVSVTPEDMKVRRYVHTCS